MKNEEKQRKVKKNLNSSLNKYFLELENNPMNNKSMSYLKKKKTFRKFHMLRICYDKFNLIEF